jgi:uncharacterized membrane protein
MRGARFILLLAALAAPAGGLRAQDQVPALYSVTDVNFDDTLNVREKPDATSAIAAKLAPDAVDIEVTGFSRDRSWARITTGERAGWVAARYLKRQEQAPWWEVATPLNCYGTEPFWSLRITDEGTEFDSPLGPEPAQPGGMRATIPAAEGVSALGVETLTGFAVIRPAECSDGMSDRIMALTIEMFRSIDGEETGYSGCCTLNP